MYDEGKSEGHCPKCDSQDFYCKCQDMCYHCEFFIDRTCKNEKSGNYKLMLPQDSYCQKFKKKMNIMTPKPRNPFW